MPDAQNEPQSEAASARTEEDLGTENLIAAYESVAEWIRFADAKAAAVLTVVGALIGVLIPTLSEYFKHNEPVDIHEAGIVVLFAGTMIVALTSSFFAFRCILPFRQKGQHPSLEKCSHFHPAAISSRYRMDQYDEFIEGYQASGVKGFQKEVMAGLLIDSHISAAKYKHVTLSIRLLGVTAIFAMLYMLAIQF
jgi:hypothetical protein